MYMQNAWYAAAWGRELKEAPLGRRICDHPVVLYRTADGDAAEVPSKFPYRPAQTGDRLLLVAPSGGGYGPASERDPQAIRDDIADGVLSPERARALYGLEA